MKANNILWLELQWTKIKLSDIAYQMKNDNKNTANITTTYSFVPLFTIFHCNLLDWLKNWSFTEPWLPTADHEFELVSWDFKILSSTQTLRSARLNLPVLKKELSEVYN